MPEEKRVITDNSYSNMMFIALKRLTKYPNLEKEEILRRNLCSTCNSHICNNNFNACPYRYFPDAHLCLTCKDRNNEIVDGILKCYQTCQYRKDLQQITKGLDKWLKEKPEEKEK